MLKPFHKTLLDQQMVEDVSPPQFIQIRVLHEDALYNRLLAAYEH